MATKRGCPAGLDCRHDPALDPAEMTLIVTPEYVAVAAEYIRHLQGWSHRRCSDRRRHLEPQAIERTRCAPDGAGGNLRVARRRIQAGVPEQRLDDPDIGAAL